MADASATNLFIFFFGHKYFCFPDMYFQEENVKQKYV